jgi:anti-sigma B factor antagonist
VAEGMLEASVAAGEYGPVIILSGEIDLESNDRLSALLARQLAGGTRQLTVDVSGLRFADSSGVRALILAALTLKDRGGSLVLLRPQEAMARVLELMGADRVFTIRGGTYGEPEAQGEGTGRG